MDTTPEIRCTFCHERLIMPDGSDLTVEQVWSALKAQHAEGCEWVRIEEEKRAPKG